MRERQEKNNILLFHINDQIEMLTETNFFNSYLLDMACISHIFNLSDAAI